jgi:hypothetical protein
MVQKVCSNPDCKAVYTADDNSDIGVCCFECYEKMFCHSPEKVYFEKIELPV